MNKIIAITKTSTVVIHNGDRTHIQLQVIILANFNPINKIVNSPMNPIPEELLFDELLDIF